MKTTPVPLTFCPFCGHTLDAATAAPLNPDAEPAAGDITLCIACAHVLIFADDGTPRKPTPDELAECMTYPEVLSGIIAVLEANARFPRSQDPRN